MKAFLTPFFPTWPTDLINVVAEFHHPFAFYKLRVIDSQRYVEKTWGLHRLLVPSPSHTVFDKSTRQIGRWLYSIRASTIAILQRVNVDTHIIEDCASIPRNIIRIGVIYWTDTYLIVTPTSDIGNFMFIYDVLTNQWREEACPALLYAITSTTHHIFACTAYKDNKGNAFYCFDPEHRKWIVLTSLQLPLDSCDLTSIGDDRLVLFGRERATKIGKMIEYSIASNTWKNKWSGLANTVTEKDLPRQLMFDSDTGSLYLASDTHVWKYNESYESVLSHF